MAEPRPIERLVIFGATGDLAARMLLPSLYHLDADGLLLGSLTIIGSARTSMSREAYVERVRRDLEIYVERLDEAVWARFAQRLDYREADVSRPEGFAGVAAAVGGAAAIYYLALSPSLYGTGCRGLE